MDINEFKEINQNVSLAAKIGLLVQILETKGQENGYKAEMEQKNNSKTADIYRERQILANQKARWLYDEIVREIDPDHIMERLDVTFFVT